MAAQLYKKTGRTYNYARLMYYIARTVPRAFGTRNIQCNVCGNYGRFLGYGFPMRFDAVCPVCGSSERHRLLMKWMRENEELIIGKDILHFSPEECLKGYLGNLSKGYKTCDFQSNSTDFTLDIEKIDLPDKCFDLIICSHVLEHVNDRKALVEVRRILRNGGTALLMFPIVEGWSETLEESDPAIQVDGPADRMKYFGQHDHVRYFGRDVRDRIRSLGFTLDEYIATEPAVSHHGLIRGEMIFILTKP